jgi:homocysteine S-methyltransferase
MLFESCVESKELMLAEGSIYELLRRTPTVSYDQHIAHAALVYDREGEEALRDIHTQYLDIGQKYQLPMTIFTDTWRAGKDRIAASRVAGENVNADCAELLLDIRASYPSDSPSIFVGGLMGCNGDAYKPEEALAREIARQYHAPHIEQLTAAGVDFLIGATLPALSEAQGIADTMAEVKLPYVLSFVCTSKGTLLDGTPLDVAVETIDQETIQQPLCYQINCVHPIVCLHGLEQTATQNRSIIGRFSGIQANTSSLRPDELDGRDLLDTETPARLTKAIWKLYERFGMHWFGGCCGTDVSHIDHLAKCMFTSRESVKQL